MSVSPPSDPMPVSEEVGVDVAPKDEIMDAADLKKSRSRSRTRSKSKSRSKSRSRSSRRSRTRSRSRSPRRSKSRSRSRSRSRSGSRHRDRRSRRHRSKSRTFSPVRTQPLDTPKIHVSGFDRSITRSDIEKAFGKFGTVVDVWLTTRAPHFAFVTYSKAKYAEEAMNELNDGMIRDCRIRIAPALPRRADYGRYGAPDRSSYGGGGYNRGYGGGGGGGYGRGYGGGGGGGYRDNYNNRSSYGRDRDRDRDYGRRDRDRKSRSRSRDRSRRERTRSKSRSRDRKSRSRSSSKDTM